MKRQILFLILAIMFSNTGCDSKKKSGFAQKKEVVENNVNGNEGEGTDLLSVKEAPESEADVSNDFEEGEEIEGGFMINTVDLESLMDGFGDKVYATKVEFNTLDDSATKSENRIISYQLASSIQNCKIDWNRFGCYRFDQADTAHQITYLFSYFKDGEGRVFAELDPNGHDNYKLLLEYDITQTEEGKPYAINKVAVSKVANDFTVAGNQTDFLMNEKMDDVVHLFTAKLTNNEDEVMEKRFANPKNQEALLFFIKHFDECGDEYNDVKYKYLKDVLLPNLHLISANGYTSNNYEYFANTIEKWNEESGILTREERIKIYDAFYNALDNYNSPKIGPKVMVVSKGHLATLILKTNNERIDSSRFHSIFFKKREEMKAPMLGLIEEATAKSNATKIEAIRQLTNDNMTLTDQEVVRILNQVNNPDAEIQKTVREVAKSMNLSPYVVHRMSQSVATSKDDASKHRMLKLLLGHGKQAHVKSFLMDSLKSSNDVVKYHALSQLKAESSITVADAKVIFNNIIVKEKKASIIDFALGTMNKVEGAYYSELVNLFIQSMKYTQGSSVVADTIYEILRGRTIREEHIMMTMETAFGTSNLQNKEKVVGILDRVERGDSREATYMIMSLLDNDDVKVRRMAAKKLATRKIRFSERVLPMVVAIYNSGVAQKDSRVKDEAMKIFSQFKNYDAVEDAIRAEVLPKESNPRYRAILLKVLK